MFEFKLPDLGEGIHEGEILKWHVQPGDAVREDDPLVEVETDKAAVTIPSPKTGRVVSIAGKPGDIVHVGDVLAVIEDTEGREDTEKGDRLTTETLSTLRSAEKHEAGSGPTTRDKGPLPASSGSAFLSVPSAPALSPVDGPQRLSRISAPAAGALSERSESKGSPPAAPATRRLARELGVDLRRVTPTGPGGRVTPEDVRAHAEGAEDTEKRDRLAAETLRAQRGAAFLSVPSAPALSPVDGPQRSSGISASSLPLLDLEPLPPFEDYGPVSREPLRSIRRKTARRMVTSATLVPHVAHLDEADVTELEELRRRERERRAGGPGGKLTILAFVVRAVVAGLRRFPMFNGSVDPFREEIVTKGYWNIGVAVDSGKGLVVPVIHGADRLSIVEVSAAIEAAAAKAREGKLDVADLRGGTFTITNIGAIGGTGMVPIINYPEVAILGLARVQEKPAVREGKIVVRRILPLTLAFDHRIADGADAARFVNEIVRLLADPATLLLEG
ncbi:MAG: 2-oxo acid dehydrogenase subunit E2 [Deltaproteobacteria bacterium]|nr:2-oxo acid dehydrogenase subunit E2 [Deltaproteobacteria bacterium]